MVTRSAVVVALLAVACTRTGFQPRRHAADRRASDSAASDEAATDGAPAGGDAARFRCTPRTSGYVVDESIYPEPAAPTLPAAGGSFVDPTFGTTILRLTDANDGADGCSLSNLSNASMNRDSTWIMFLCDTTEPLLASFDPITVTLGDKRPLFAEPTPDAGWPIGAQGAWSRTDPDVIFAHENLRLWSYSVRSDTYQLVKDFSAELPTGHFTGLLVSNDDDTFALGTRDALYTNVGWLVWRRSSDKLLVHRNELPNTVMMSADGRWLLRYTGQRGAGVTEAELWDLEMVATVAALSDEAPDFLPPYGNSGLGGELLIGQEDGSNFMNLRRLSLSQSFTPVRDFGSDWSHGHHVANLPDDESWALVKSWSDGPHTPGLLYDELYAIATDGTGRLRRLAHHRSVIDSYLDHSGPEISRDGCFVPFTSNFGTSRRDVYMLSLAAP